MAKTNDISSDDLKQLWLDEADAQESNGNKARARRMRRGAQNSKAWKRTEKELRRSQAEHGGSFDWKAIIKSLLPVLLDLLKGWLGE